MIGRRFILSGSATVSATTILWVGRAHRVGLRRWPMAHPMQSWSSWL